MVNDLLTINFIKPLLRGPNHCNPTLNLCKSCIHPVPEQVLKPVFLLPPSLFLTPGPPSTSPAPPPALAPPLPRRSPPPAATMSSCASPWRSQLGSRRRQSFGGGRRRRSCSASSSCHSWRNESWAGPAGFWREGSGPRTHGRKGQRRRLSNLNHTLYKWLEIKKQKNAKMIFVVS